MVWSWSKSKNLRRKNQNCCTRLVSFVQVQSGCDCPKFWWRRCAFRPEPARQPGVPQTSLCAGPRNFWFSSLTAWSVAGWFKATQAMAILGLIGLTVSCVLGFLYMFVHRVSKMTTLIVMTILLFLSGACRRVVSRLVHSVLPLDETRGGGHKCCSHGKIFILLFAPEADSSLWSQSWIRKSTRAVIPVQAFGSFCCRC